jgi:hypothetical protein
VALTLQFTQATLNNVSDVAGLWQYEGGKVSEGSAQVGNYASIKRTIVGGTDQNDMNSAIVTTTILITGHLPPENITLQGVHRFDAGWEIGSVSAATESYSSNIGHQYNRDGSTNIVTIF